MVAHNAQAAQQPWGERGTTTGSHRQGTPEGRRAPCQASMASRHCDFEGSRAPHWHSWSQRWGSLKSRREPHLLARAREHHTGPHRWSGLKGSGPGPRDGVATREGGLPAGPGRWGSFEGSRALRQPTGPWKRGIFEGIGRPRWVLKEGWPWGEQASQLGPGSRVTMRGVSSLPG